MSRLSYTHGNVKCFSASEADAEIREIFGGATEIPRSEGRADKGGKATCGASSLSFRPDCFVTLRQSVFILFIEGVSTASHHVREVSQGAHQLPPLRPPNRRGGEHFRRMGRRFLPTAYTHRRHTRPHSTSFDAVGVGRFTSALAARSLAFAYPSVIIRLFQTMAPPTARRGVCVA